MNPSGLTPTQTSQIRQNIGVLGNKNSSEDAKNEAIKSLKQNVGSIRGQLVLMTQDEQKTTLGELNSILIEIMTNPDILKDINTEKQLEYVLNNFEKVDQLSRRGLGIQEGYSMHASSLDRTDSEASLTTVGSDLSLSSVSSTQSDVTDSETFQDFFNMTDDTFFKSCYKDGQFEFDQFQSDLAESLSNTTSLTCGDMNSLIDSLGNSPLRLLKKTSLEFLSWVMVSDIGLSADSTFKDYSTILDKLKGKIDTSTIDSLKKDLTKYQLQLLGDEKGSGLTRASVPAYHGLALQLFADQCDAFDSDQSKQAAASARQSVKTQQQISLAKDSPESIAGFLDHHFSFEDVNHLFLTGLGNKDHNVAVNIKKDGETYEMTIVNLGLNSDLYGEEPTFTFKGPEGLKKLSQCLSQQYNDRGDDMEGFYNSAIDLCSDTTLEVFDPNTMQEPSNLAKIPTQHMGNCGSLNPLYALSLSITDPPFISADHPFHTMSDTLLFEVSQSANYNDEISTANNHYKNVQAEIKELEMTLNGYLLATSAKPENLNSKTIVTNDNFRGEDMSEIAAELKSKIGSILMNISLDPSNMAVDLMYLEDQVDRLNVTFPGDQSTLAVTTGGTISTYISALKSFNSATNQTEGNTQSLIDSQKNVFKTASGLMSNEDFTFSLGEFESSFSSAATFLTEFGLQPEILPLLNQSSSMARTILTRLEQSIESHLAKSDSLDYNDVYQEFADGFSALIEGFGVDASKVETVQ